MDRLDGLIIPNKLKRPPVRPDLVIRQNSYDKLTRGLSKRLTLVSAPAGFGKTTLISAWLQQLNVPVAWLSLDRQDDRIDRFILYLAASFGFSIADHSPPGRERLLSLDLPFDEFLFAEMYEAMAHRVPFTVLVLDDYHVISDPAIHDLVWKLIQTLPESDWTTPGGGRGCHIVLISRTDPPFHLSRWRLHQVINEIGVKDLRFLEPEAIDLFHRVLGSDIPVDKLAALSTHSEGWVAGLQLTALSLLGQNRENVQDFIQEFSGSNRLIADYLMEEVISHEPEIVQSFLVDTCILEDLTGSLCDAVTGRNDGQSMLERLERSNLFVAPLDTNRKWYRYHQLFADVLNKRCECQGEEKLRVLHARAATWFESQEYFEQSVRHYLAAGRVDEAARVLTQAAPRLLSQFQGFFLKTLLEAFPDRAFQQWPWLSIYRAWANVIPQPGSIEVWLTQAEQAIGRSKSAVDIIGPEKGEMLGNIAAIRALTALRKGAVEETLANAAQALALLPVEATNVRGLMNSSIAGIRHTESQLGEALTVLRQSVAELRQRGNLAGAAIALNISGEILVLQGQLNSAANTYGEVLSLEKSSGLSSFLMTGLSYTGLGNIQYEWNQIEEALVFLQEGCRWSEQMDLREQVSSGIGLARALIGLSDFEEAGKILQQFETLPSHTVLSPLLESGLAACKLRLFTEMEDLDRANRLIDERRMDSIVPDNFLREAESMAMAFHLFHRGQLEGAGELTRRLEQEMARGGRVDRQIKMLILQGVTLQKLNEMPSAMAALNRAVHLAAHEGYLRSFLEYGDPVLDLILKLTQPGTARGLESLDLAYATRIGTEILHSGAKHRPPSRPLHHLQSSRQNPPALIEPLTSPELEVLRLLAVGHKKGDIADEIGVSINTVKTHVNHIYSKLGVHNRVQAVILAKRLNLL